MTGRGTNEPGSSRHDWSKEARSLDGWCRGPSTHAPRVIAILQPVYLPWLGYFEQMAYADLFVVLDDVQYTRHDWRNRNRVRTADGPVWLTVPVRRHARSATIREIRVNFETDWQRRHLRTIELAYGRCSFIEPLYSELEAAYAHRDELLLDLDVRLMRVLAACLGVSTPIAMASEVPLRADPDHRDLNGRIIDICHYFSASVLYDGAKAAAFIDRGRFRRVDLEVVFQDYRHPEYRQRFPGFISHLSAVDLIMNAGPAAPGLLRTSPVPDTLRNACARGSGELPSAGADESKPDD